MTLFKNRVPAGAELTTARSVDPVELHNNDPISEQSDA